LLTLGFDIGWEVREVLSFPSTGMACKMETRIGPEEREQVKVASTLTRQGKTTTYYLDLYLLLLRLHRGCLLSAAVLEKRRGEGKIGKGGR
jgi:hypothetical protein